MSESVQAVLTLSMIVGIIGSVIAFMTDRVHWAWLASMPTLAIASLALLLWSLFRRDKMPDFLANIPGPLLERDGFCFKVATSATKGRCYVTLHFQSRYDRPSRAVVVIQPSKGFFLTRPDLGRLTLSIDCPAAGYGLAAVPWAVAKKFQGKVQRLDVAADVEYPEGKGRMIRYRGGTQIRTAGHDTFRTVATLAGAMGATIVLMKPASIKLKFPKDVDETIDYDLPIALKTQWRLGDPIDPQLLKKRPPEFLDF